MVVTQVEKDVVVSKVGKPEAKPRIVTFIEGEGGLRIFEPAKYMRVCIRTCEICRFVRTSERENVSQVPGNKSTGAQLFYVTVSSYRVPVA